MESIVKKASVVAPLFILVLLSPSLDSGSLIGLALILFPYFIVFLVAHFAQNAGSAIAVANAIFLVGLVSTSLVAIVFSRSDPQSAIGVMFFFLLQCAAAVLFVGICVAIWMMKKWVIKNGKDKS